MNNSDGPPVEWITEQNSLKGRLDLDVPDGLHVDYIVGIDISLTKGSEHGVCTGVLISFPDLELIDQITQEVTVSEVLTPYFAGYLAFREVPHYLAIHQALAAKHPGKCDQLIMTDGNGILHPNGFGLASHLGVLLDIPTIGCGKALHQYSKLQYNKKELRALMDATDERCTEMEVRETAVKKEARSEAGKLVGYALRGDNVNPIYVSQGHLISASDCLRISRATMKVREPEPTRLADRISREYLRQQDQ